MLSLYCLCKTIAGNNRLNKVWKKVCTVAAALVDIKYLVLLSGRFLPTAHCDCLPFTESSSREPSMFLSC